MQKIFNTVFSFLLVATFFSCSKEDFITSGSAQLTVTDSIKFDTVFTTTGSITKSFKIFNDNDQKLLLNKIKLMGGNTSPFTININGAAVNEMNDIVIAANDSIYVFVTVRIDPSTANIPFVISDSILIQYNGNIRYVQLQAYGQNAIFLRNTIITGAVNWTNTLPYVILGGIRVDTTAALTIQQGTRIYFHADAPMVVDGTLIVSGTLNQKVIFTGDRLDVPYVNFPASWPGIYFRNTSINNNITHAEIKNAYQAVVVLGPSMNTQPKLRLEKVTIDNAYDAGLLCNNSSVQMNNSLISNSQNNIVIETGGDYSFTHCTIASYSTDFILHNNPVISIADFGFINGALSFKPLSTSFVNCIIWADNSAVPSEIQVNKQGNLAFNVTVDHCLYKATNDPSNTTFINSIKNIDPLFDTIDYNNNRYDFRISNPLAPGIDKGITTTFLTDLDDKPRTGLPDLGCFEKQ